MCLKSFIRRFTRLFCKQDVFTSVYLGKFKTCSMMIFLYHFNMFLYIFERDFMLNCALFYAILLYIYTLFVVYFYTKKCIEQCCFLCLKWVKYCGEVCGKLSDLWCKCDVKLSVLGVVFILFGDNFIVICCYILIPGRCQNALIYGVYDGRIMIELYMVWCN